MKSDLRGLARHLGNLLAYCGVVSLLAAGIVWLVGRGETSTPHTGVVIVLVALGVQELIVWFGLVLWADTAGEQS